MELRQFRVFEHFGCVTMRAINVCGPKFNLLGATVCCSIVRPATVRTTTMTSPPPPRCRKSARKPISPSYATNAYKSTPLHIFQQLSRSTLIMSHSMHQNCLCTITSSYRQLANNYTLLLNASIIYTICRPEIPLHIYPSVVDNSLDIIIQRWLNTYHYAQIY